jgi:branched-chain amino acid transport system substrate-binding protein
MTTPGRRRVVAALITIGLVVAACGGDDGEDTATEEPTGTATGATATASTGATGVTTTTRPADPLAALGINVKNDCPSDYKPAQGVSASEILVGQSVPKTGPGAAFSLLTKGMQAYFDYANAELNGVNGRKLTLVSLDDAYEPEKTVKNVNDLLTQGVFVTSGILGTPNNLAVRDVLNDKCVPHLYPSTGAPDWGDVKDYPWTVSGPVIAYNAEARMWADHLKKTFPNGANVVALQIANAFGQDYETWLKKYLEGSNIKLTKIEKHDPATLDVKNQVTTLAATKAEVVIHMTTSSACLSAMREVGASGWKPLQIVSGTCKTSLFFAGAGEGAKDALIAASVKEITYPEFDTDAAIVALRANLQKYAQDTGAISLVPTGWVFGEMLRDTLLRAEKLEGGLTRPNVLLAARQTNFSTGYFYAPLKLDGTTDVIMGEFGRMEKWNGTAFEKVTDLTSYEGTTKAKP